MLTYSTWSLHHRVAHLSLQISKRDRYHIDLIQDGYFGLIRLYRRRQQLRSEEDSKLTHFCRRGSHGDSFPGKNFNLVLFLCKFLMTVLLIFILLSSRYNQNFTPSDNPPPLIWAWSCWLSQPLQPAATLSSCQCDQNPDPTHPQAGRSSPGGPLFIFFTFHKRI